MAARLRVKPDAVEWRELDGEIVALDLRSSVYVALNRSGTVLWPMLLRGATHDSLSERLAAEFKLSSSQAGGDVDTFLAELREMDLLEA